jgi:hypothetical protein
MEELFVARTVRGGQSRSNSANTARLRSSRSGTASTTRSASPTPAARSVEARMRPTTADRSSAESVPAASRFAQATRRLRSLRDDLVALNTVRTASARIVRHSLTWRMRAAPMALEQERANQLDLLASSGVMLARTAVATSHQERPSLAPAIRHLATALAEISRNPGGRATRQHGADRALDLASWLIRMGPPYRRSTRWLPLAPPFG